MCERVSVCVSVRVWWGGLTGHPPLRAGRGRSVAPLGGPGSRDISPTAAAPCPVVGSVSPRSVSAPQGRGSHVRPRCTPGRLRQTEEEQTAGGGGCGVILGRRGGGGRPRLAWQCLGSPPGAPGWVGGDSSPSKPVAGRPRLRQTSNICLEPSLLPALTTIYKNYFYQRNTHIW